MQQPNPCSLVIFVHDPPAVKRSKENVLAGVPASRWRSENWMTVRTCPIFRGREGSAEQHPPHAQGLAMHGEAVEEQCPCPEADKCFHKPANLSATFTSRNSQIPKSRYLNIYSPVLCSSTLSAFSSNFILFQSQRMSQAALWMLARVLRRALILWTFFSAEGSSANYNSVVQEH